MPSSKYLVIKIIQVAAFAVFAGRAYQHLFWDAPYREIFWDPFYFQGIVESILGMTWEEYVTHPEGDDWFQDFIRIKGIFYAICAFVVFFIKKLPSWTRVVLIIGGIDLIFLALVYMKDKFYHFGQFFEYALQFSTPFFLYVVLKKDIYHEKLMFWMKVAIALTFVCHGLYAVGYYPRPQSFMTMTNHILGLKEEATILFLLTAGVLDFVIAIFLFLPFRKWVLAALGYAVFWGFCTTFARILGNFYIDFPLESIHQWGYEVQYRLPHFLIPLALIIMITTKHRNKAMAT